MNAQPTFYDALSHPPNPLAGHEPNLTIYRDSGEPQTGFVEVDTGIEGLMLNDDKKSYRRTTKYKIAYTIWGNKGPVIGFLHGVPTNRRQWYPVQRLAARFGRTVSFDMLGMGESDKPRGYGGDRPIDESNAWDWINDVSYVDQLMNKLFPAEPFFFVADDWGGGIAAHYAAAMNERLLGLILLDPIAFDGYPVGEIQDFGQASTIPEDNEFMKALGPAHQTMLQIFKTMVRDSAVWNQYSTRDLEFTYFDVDYERSAHKDGEDADSVTLRYHRDAFRVLADRAAVLAPAQLLPFEGTKNPRGPDYTKITKPVLVLWGAQDNMMPANQIYRFENVIPNADVQGHLIPDAGHFAGVDQPKRVAEEIIRFVARVIGRNKLADVFLGFTGIWKGDENEMIQDLRKLWGIVV